MLDIVKDTFIDAVIDSVKILPFLFITYLIMEYIEHKMSKKSKDTIKKSGKWGPLLGSIVGIIPQCGFSVSATNLYATRVISLGTLIAVYLSTSDEMIPIFISESVPIIILVKILLIKFFIGILFGFLIDFVLRKRNKSQEEQKIEDLCEHDHCHCDEKGILKSAIKHTVNILIYILIITFLINIIVESIGEDNFAKFVGNHAILGPAISSLIGLIPNCAASVIITNLYLQNIISGASLIAGLLTGAGVGLIVLFKTNKSIKENLIIVGLIYGVGVFSGVIFQLVGLSL